MTKARMAVVERADNRPSGGDPGTSTEWDETRSLIEPIRHRSTGTVDPWKETLTPARSRSSTAIWAS